MQTKEIETKYKEIYYTPKMDNLVVDDAPDDQVFKNMDLLALTNIAFINYR